VEAERLQNLLLSSVSHDLRTPLAAITGAGTALRDERAELGAEQREELVETICAEAERMERLVANILDMVRIESGAAVLRREWVPLEEVVGSVLGRFGDRLESREVKLSLPEDLPMLSLDPVLFEQVLVNLLDNALKYTPPGRSIEIAARAEEGGVGIDVADRGPGIPAGDEERVFEKFHRGSHPGVLGAGLGLSICRGIVQAHGGTILAANRTEGGAIFRIRLPSVGAPPVVATDGAMPDTPRPLP
jgi:two-component system sensor histidine kinase KdpD